MGKVKSRPLIYDFNAIGDFVAEMLDYLKATEPKYSIQSVTRELPGCSRTLVSRVAQGKRKLTRNQVENFSDLLRLSVQETKYLDQWVRNEQSPRRAKKEGSTRSRVNPTRVSPRPNNHLLSNWLNVYVKDACRLRGFKPDPFVISRLLGGIASPKQIQKSLDFLFKEGFLRHTLDGKVIQNQTIDTTTDEIPDNSIAKFHKRSLDIAKQGVDSHSVDTRRASACVLTLNKQNLAKLKKLLAQSMDQVLEFAGEHADDDQRLYQVVMHLTPVGGQIDEKK